MARNLTWIRPARPEEDRPDDRPLLTRIAPRGLELLLGRRDRVFAGLPGVALEGRPGPDIGEIPPEVPLRFEGQRRRLHLGKGEWNRPVLLVDPLALGRPPGTH